LTKGYGAVAMLPGNGDGSFGAALAFAVGFGPSDVAVGDFNHDGVPDLAVISTQGNVSILVGDGDGTFHAEPTFGAGRAFQSVAASDFNGDGQLDLVVTDDFPNTVSVLINNTATYDLTVSHEGNGSGTVTSTSVPASAKQIDCGTECTAPYHSGSQVILTAYADLGSTFAGWSGCDDVSDATCTVSINRAKSVAATFTLQRFTLTVTKEGKGQGTVTSSSDPAGPAEIDCGTTCSANYDWNTVVTLTATPGVADHFKGWSGCDSESGATCVVTMRAETSVTARFVGRPLEREPGSPK